MSITSVQCVSLTGDTNVNHFVDNIYRFDDTQQSNDTDAPSELESHLQHMVMIYH